MKLNKEFLEVLKRGEYVVLPRLRFMFRVKDIDRGTGEVNIDLEEGLRYPDMLPMNHVKEDEGAFNYMVSCRLSKEALDKSFESKENEKQLLDSFELQLDLANSNIKNMMIDEYKLLKEERRRQKDKKEENKQGE